MTTDAPGAPRMPHDLDARQRLQQAQRAETAATGAVYRAEAGLARAHAKRETVLASATTEVVRARRRLGDAHHRLIEISGLTRAAQLLGTTRAALRRSAADRTEGTTQ